MLRSSVAGGLLCSLLFVTGCSLDVARVEGAIKETLEEEGFTVASVECPPGTPMKKGHDFMCLAMVGGQEIPMEVKQTDGRGTVSYKPKFMVVKVDEYEKEIRSQPGFDGATEIDCHGEAWVSEPAATYTCDVTAHGEAFEVTILFKDENGLHDIEAVPRDERAP